MSPLNARGAASGFALAGASRKSCGPSYHPMVMRWDGRGTYELSYAREVQTRGAMSEVIPRALAALSFRFLDASSQFVRYPC